MNRLGWFVGAGAVAAVVSLAMWALLGHRHAHAEDELHAWMHANLDLTPEQDASLHPLEEAFEEERRQMHAAIEEAGTKLGTALLKGDLQSPEAQTALDALESAQARLRRCTLEHFFAMRDHLDPEQSERLLTWVAKSIAPDGSHD